MKMAKRPLKPLEIGIHPDDWERCLFHNNTIISSGEDANSNTTTPTPSTTIFVENQWYYCPSEIWRMIFEYVDLYTISMLMQCQKKWMKLYKEKGFKSKIQFLRMMTWELVVFNTFNTQLSSAMNVNNILPCSSSNIMHLSSSQQKMDPLAMSGVFEMPLSQTLRNGELTSFSRRPNRDYNDLSKIIRKIDTFKTITVSEAKRLLHHQEKVFSVFNLINNLFKPQNNSPQRRNETQSFARDAFARIAIVGEKCMSKTTFFKTYRAQKERIHGISSEQNCFDDTVTLHTPSNSTSSNFESFNSNSYQIWDEYQSMSEMPPYFLRRMNFLILLFDSSNIESFVKLKHWVYSTIINGNFKSNRPELILVATKHDLISPKNLTSYLTNRETQFKPFADELRIPYIEIDSTNTSQVLCVVRYALCWTYFVQSLRQAFWSLDKQRKSNQEANTFSNQTKRLWSDSFVLPHMKQRIN